MSLGNSANKRKIRTAYRFVIGETKKIERPLWTFAGFYAGKT
jgi:hypothetical protein